MSNEIAQLDAKIAAIKNSPEYRRLIITHRGPREDNELSKLNTNITTLENKKAFLELSKQQTQPTSRPPTLGKPAPVKDAVPVNRQDIGKPVAPAPYKVSTFVPSRPVGLKSPPPPGTPKKGSDTLLTAPPPSSPLTHEVSKKGQNNADNMDEQDLDDLVLEPKPSRTITPPAPLAPAVPAKPRLMPKVNKTSTKPAARVRSKAKAAEAVRELEAMDPEDV